MKKLGLGILIILIVLAISGVALAIPNQAANIAKEKAKAPDLEKIEFIHWKKGFAKPPCNGDGICDSGEKPSCADCKDGGNGEEPITTCYAFMGKYGKKLLKWGETPVSYTINPKNPGQLSEPFVTDTISAGVEEWNYWTGGELFNDSYNIDYTATYGVQDYMNTIAWGDYSIQGVIGVTTIWYSPATKTIVEFDIMFDVDFTWGDAATDITVMDLQNIATHELGHGIGLADVYETTCSGVTMYGYSDNGEIIKRTLEASDITGLQSLYGF